jgi:hypothetical protein
MYLDCRIIAQQKHGIVLCIPNTDTFTTPVKYRPIILLDTDYNMLARLVANRLELTLFDLLHSGQYCGMPANTIFDAASTIRDAIA